MNDSKKIPRCQITGSIYLIYCVVTDKCYVGQTIQKVNRRITQHKCGNQLIDKEIQKLGWKGNFDYFVLEENIPLINLDALEKYWIEVFDSVYPNGYNATSGGAGAGHAQTQETRKKIADKLKGKPFTEEHRENLRICHADVRGERGEKNPMYGKGDLVKGEKNPMYGRVAWNKGKKCPEHSARISGKNHPNYGKPSPFKGVPRSKETREKISASHKARHKNKLIGKFIAVLQAIIDKKIKIRDTLIKKDIMKKIFAALIEVLSEQ